MKVREFMERNPELKELYVSPEGRWFDAPRSGFERKTRAEILGESTETETAPAPAEPESAKKEEKSTKKNKK
jgi:hypothetical protein